MNNEKHTQYPSIWGLFKKHALAEAGGPSCPESVEGKAAGPPGLRSHFGGVGLARGVYSEYVSTTMGPVRRCGPFDHTQGMFFQRARDLNM